MFEGDTFGVPSNLIPLPVVNITMRVQKRTPYLTPLHSSAESMPKSQNKKWLLSLPRCIEAKVNA